MAGLTPVSYVIGTGASITAILTGARAYYRSQRKRFMNEGAQRERNAKALEANTEASEANTAAIGRLGEKLETFAGETRRELANHDTRIGQVEHRAAHLEDLMEGGFRQQARKPGDGN